MSSIFDEVVNRKNTDSLKWDYCKQRFGKSGILPMWVADMDFKSPSIISEAIIQRPSMEYSVIPRHRRGFRQLWPVG
ncbi:hypothetical protein [Acetivibrio straminisolvens]|uniref:Cystathionine beta-lyase n=1 Tax=Acetivibrio straminisolvens JCM 21531 TaxID=1294263 RepID=W4V1V9_9FIRM|nr:hypothetical protein [Acetivibrio straminisolvens]GAE86798.1 cystathionine beta-lyase [Acetivibrio straminisolvens JCM 21531]